MKYLLALLVTVGCGAISGPTTFDTKPPVHGSLSVVIDEPDRVFVERSPVLVAGGSEAFVYRDSITLLLGERIVREVFVFNGLDRGDIAEMGTAIYVDDVPIFLRSLHKEDLTTFDSWESKYVNASGSQLRIDILCRTTGVNVILNRLASRPHWGIWLYFGDPGVTY